MSVSVNSFFDGLNVNSRYYLKLFKSYGIENRFFFNEVDLMLIVQNLPRKRYKSDLVFRRASELLGASYV